MKLVSIGMELVFPTKTGPQQPVCVDMAAATFFIPIGRINTEKKIAYKAL